MKRQLLVVSASLASALLWVACGGTSPDSCTPTQVVAETVPVACQVVHVDGGPATGFAARCTNGDGGAATDATGTFSFSAHHYLCGLVAGTYDCGMVQLVQDGGAVDFTPAGEDAGVSQIFPAHLDGGSCQLRVP